MNTLKQNWVNYYCPPVPTQGYVNIVLGMYNPGWPPSSQRLQYVSGIVPLSDAATVTDLSKVWKATPSTNLSKFWGATAASGQPQLLFTYGSIFDPITCQQEETKNVTIWPRLFQHEESENVASMPTREEMYRWQVDGFLGQVYELAEMNDLQGATDIIFDHLDRLLIDGSFIVCNQILRKVDVKSLPTALMRSFLTITNAAKEKLTARSKFYRDVEQEMTRLKGDVYTKRLLGKLN